jgi:hypothetical protein
MQARSPFPLLYICSHADADADVKGPSSVALLVGAADERGIGGAHVEASLAMSGSDRLSLGEMGDKDVS